MRGDTMPKSVQMKESLSGEQLEGLCSRLKSLPTAEEFKQRAETDLWRIIADRSKSDEAIDYESLTESNKQLIGTISTDDGATRLPWWLEEFKWTATSIGEEEITLDKSNFSKFQNFVPEQTVIKRPRLRRHHSRKSESNDVYNALRNFKEIQEKLEKHLDVEEAAGGLDLPKNIFAARDRGIQTTSEFQDWFNSLVNLCPPFNEQLTAILMLNTKVKMDLAREILPEEVLASIENIGLVTNGEIYNKTYFESIASASYRRKQSSKRLLRYDWKVFDLQIPYVNDDYDHLSPLEAALFESWVEHNTEVAKKYNEYLMNTSIPSQTEYARVALQAPIMKERGRSKFVTLEQIKDKSLSSNSKSKGSELREILEKNGIEDD